MMKKFLFVILMIFGLCLSFETRAENFNIKEFYLDNGLQVVVIENHKAPIVQQMLFYKVGAVDEKPGQGGIAHLLEHLMFRGTAKIEGQKFNRVLEQNGAESNAFTAYDVTAYHQLLDISRLELAMFLEADRMKGLDIGKEDFATERDIVFEERKQRIDNNPLAVFMEKVRAALWQKHPYGKPVTGEDDEIKNLTREMAVDFYKTYYAPNNAVLVLAGDVDADAAERLAKKYYGNVRQSEFEATQFEKLPEKYEAKIKMELPEVRVGRLVRMFVAPSINVEPEMVYALDVLAEYLAGDENAAMYQELVLKSKTAASVEVSYDGIARSYGSFVLAVVPSGDMKSDFEDKIERAWRKAINNLTKEKIDKVKQKMLADLVYLQDNPASLAQIVGYIAASGGKLEYLQTYANKIASVTAEDVKNAAEYLQNRAPKVTGILYPEGEFRNE